MHFLNDMVVEYSRDITILIALATVIYMIVQLVSKWSFYLFTYTVYFSPITQCYKQIAE